MKQFILRTLNALFPNPKPSLEGWSSPFQLLIAILLSGNSTDKAVNSVTPQLFAKAPDAQSILDLPPGKLYQLIAPCGLGERKSAYIYQLSQILVRDFHGEPPNDMALLTQLPGVGRKTASVFLGIAYGKPTFPVDTHILRLAQRWKISEKKSPSAAEKDLARFFGHENTPKLHLQLIYYARQYCPALHHKIDNCPICSYLAKEANSTRT
ncbi:endonuclease III [Chlamydia pneumoniae TW-183]|uniref:Endonuclease III n=2 Tax=Chlamydia pneumoniae TaxID=83558 RepID=Q9Z769_CHLPN|nr:endonuclease III [Chlamydia pneumoniae]AAD18975.1 Enodnuclease III [Chlamydia pneumoniae CWL029]AAF38807.1 endonuclease III [Chlamydia pneumoniae AR39]AAP98795.1 endonuclease III [Chlamydia pneumoniae TW-183]CRI33356.1 Endonuclease III [Chlamydia pneumoniae]CRI36219.1 Endonuclease III [Chlamydia pneumoniae]